MPRESLDIIRKHGIGLKGPLATPIGKGHQSLNLALRKYVMVFVFKHCYILFKIIFFRKLLKLFNNYLHLDLFYFIFLQNR